MVSNSQEKMIYRSLAGRIQLGFYGDGQRLPSLQQLARRYQVSYCPVQRALKALERDGLVKLGRGHETVVLKKPFAHYLQSPVFRSRQHALADLAESLRLLSPAVGLQGMVHAELPAAEADGVKPGKRFYTQFDQCLQALGSRIVLTLYYDIGAFAESAFLDILAERLGAEGADRFLRRQTVRAARAARRCAEGRHGEAKRLLEQSGEVFFDALARYFAAAPPLPDDTESEVFSWEPRKGRTRYCDDIALDLICKINRGVYPAQTLLPTNEALADIYHVSAITMRRTVGLLNRLGVAKTKNGVGTQVVSVGDASLFRQMKTLMLDENLRTFLEALQLLAVTCEPILRFSFSHFPQSAMDALVRAVSIQKQDDGINAAVSAIMQAVVRYCPRAAIREIYGKLTLLLLKGGVLCLNEVGGTWSAPCWPALSVSLADSLKTGDGPLFAKSFRLLTEENFRTAKRILLEIGVDGVSQVAEPAAVDG